VIYGGHTYHLDDLGETVAETVNTLRNHQSKFDFIVVTGVSGILVGAPVAVALDIPIVVVRKPDDRAHDEQDVVNYAHAEGRWIFLDDFRQSGRTIKRVQERMGQRLRCGKKFSPPKEPLNPPVYVGNYMYGEDSEYPEDLMHWAVDELPEEQELALERFEYYRLMQQASAGLDNLLNELKGTDDVVCPIR
jgi:hypothetical protein